MEDRDYYTYGPFYVGINTDPEEVRQKFLQAFTKIPPELRSFLLNDVTTEKIVQMGTAAGVTKEEILLLSRIVRDLVTGALFLGDVPALVSQKLGLDPATAQALISGLLNELLAPVIVQVKQVQSEAFAERLGRPKTPTLRQVRPPQSIEPKPTSIPPASPPRPSVPAKPRQVSNLGYLLQDQPAPSGKAPANPNNVIDLRNQQK